MNIRELRWIELVANRNCEADLQPFTGGYVQRLVPLRFFCQRFVDVSGCHRVRACVIDSESFKRGHQVDAGIERFRFCSRYLAYANAGVPCRDHVIDRRQQERAHCSSTNHPRETDSQFQFGLQEFFLSMFGRLNTPPGALI